MGFYYKICINCTFSTTSKLGKVGLDARIFIVFDNELVCMWAVLVTPLFQIFNRSLSAVLSQQNGKYLVSHRYLSQDLAKKLRIIEGQRLGNYSKI